MNATSVASSGQMFSPFNPKTQSSSQAAFNNPFAPRPQSQNEGASFGLDGAGDSSWAQKNKRKARFNEQSDNENKPPKANPPFKTHDANLSDGGKHKKTRGADVGKKGVEGNKNLKRVPDDPKRPRQPNGNGVNGTHHAANAEKNNESRSASPSSASSANENINAYPINSTDPFARKVYDRLRKDGISPPSWPSQPGNPKNKAEMAKFREKYEEYRTKVRASLTKAGLIDDPEKRKTLQDAIDFRGICEDMCPEYEKITRITELDVPHPEKGPGTTFANTTRMVKKLARSAAGQEAPLPMDVRSTTTLRRTLDYLINDLLQDDDNLPGLHGFLWDRTRAIRRDFTFLSSPTPQDLESQAYVFENIVRFHVTSLHLLSQEGKAGEDFVEQQELEQLGKALLSLRDLYDDCNAQGITCPNEAEFRAYYLIFHAHDSNTLEMLQRQWKPHLWKDSNEIRTAVSLVEALQNTVDFHGPLKHGPSLAASTALLSYFRIVESPSVSYIMACFAECHFPHLRRSILRAVRRAMARPKDTANDVTAETLNRFLRFDTIQEAIDFAKFHDVEVVPDPQAPKDLGRRLLVLNNKGPLPCPRLQHQFSRNLVEKKRASLSLPDVIHGAIFIPREFPQSGANGSLAAAERPMNVGVVRFGKEASAPHSETPNSFGAKASTPSPFGSVSQAPSVLGDGLVGASQASAPTFGAVGGMNGQPSATQSNPFASASSTTTPASNPFASLPSSNHPPQNPFGSVASSSGGATTTNPFASSTPAFPALQSKDAPQQPANPASQPSFPSIQQPGTYGAPQSKPLFPLGEKTAEAKPTVSTPFAPNTPSFGGNKLSTPSFTLTGAQDGIQQTPFNGLGPSLSATPQTSAGSSILGGGLTVSKTPAFPASITAQGGLGSAVPTTGSVLPKPTVGSAPFPFSSVGTTSNSLSGSLGAKASEFSKPNLPLSASFQAAEQKPGIQSFPGALGGFPTSNPLSSSTNVKAPLAPNLSTSGLSTTPPNSPPRLAGLTSTVARRPRDLLGDFTKWFVQGDNGLLQEFEVFMVESVLSAVYQKYQTEKEEKNQREKEERDNAEAKKFRLYNLSLKYFYRWKQNARERRLRQLRRSGRDQFRAFHQATRAAQLKEEEEAARRIAKQKAEMAALNRPEEMANVLRKSINNRKRAEEALLASRVLSGVGNEREAVARIVRREPSLSQTLSIDGDRESRSRSGSVASFVSIRGGSKTRALREELLGAKPARFRRSLPSLSPAPGSESDKAHRVSKVSERWRLKAMGIVQMPDGTALPETMVDEIKRGMRRDMSSSSTRRASVASATRNRSRLSTSPAVVDNTAATHKRKRSNGDEGEALKGEMNRPRRRTSEL
ncbi:SAC3 family protein 1 [Cladobotryum mycophilum]|uniref:SAC3 family protein 1 n=1 Tax=Cladobotryum mycophilum TaxID=491253 RepID=A0ABR0SNH7_9HYPO